MKTKLGKWASGFVYLILVVAVATGLAATIASANPRVAGEPKTQPFDGLLDDGFISPGRIKGNAWTRLNDGPDSGLDADTLDGMHASSFMAAMQAQLRQAGMMGPAAPGATTMPGPSRASGSNSGYTSSSSSFSSLSRAYTWSGMSGVPSGFADGVDNNTEYSAGAHLALVGTEFSLIDGAGSGLDGDLLDGLDSTDFARTAHSHDFKSPEQIALLKWYDANLTVSVEVGGNPQAAAYDGAGIWAASASSNTLTKVNAVDGTVVATVEEVISPRAIAFDGRYVWVSTPDGVLKLKASDGSSEGSYAVSGSPQGLAFDGAHIWVANSGTNSVTKVKALDGTILGVFAVGSEPRGVAFDGVNVWVANSGSNTVTKLRASDGKTIGSYAVGSRPQALAYDGANIWVANGNSSSATKLKASDGSLVGTYAVGGRPQGVVFDGFHVWVANQESDSVTKLRASDGKQIGTYPTGSGPRGMAFDGAYVWVANSGAGTLSKM
ncbi:MAG: YncE family protein [Candidatus Aquicultorales bacterium]